MKATAASPSDPSYVQDGRQKLRRHFRSHSWFCLYLKTEALRELLSAENAIERGLEPQAQVWLAALQTTIARDSELGRVARLIGGSR
jgi:hypothetical protein